jgi:hypothetical protein
MATKAIAMIDDYAEKAKKTGQDAFTVNLSREGKVFAIRRMRMDDQAARMMSRYRSERRPIPGIWLMGVLCGQLQQQELKKLAADRQTIFELHSLWRASIPANTDDAATRLKVSKDHESALSDEIESTVSGMQTGECPTSSAFTYLHLLLDFVEAAQLVGDSVDWPRVQQIDFFSDFIDRHLQSPRLYRQDDLLAILMRQAVLHGQYRSELIDSLTKIIGPRRAAEVAFEEGETMALRLPDPALFLWEMASHFYNLAKDPVGEVLSTTLLTLSTIRSKKRDQAARLVRERLQPAYERLLGDDKLISKNLPDWQTLEKLRLDKPESEMLKMARDWRGWLERIHCCQVWAAAQDGDAQIADRFIKWLSSRYQILPPDYPDYTVLGPVEPGGGFKGSKTSYVPDLDPPLPPRSKEPEPEVLSPAPGGLRLPDSQQFQKIRQDGEKPIMDLFIETQRPRALSASRLSKSGVDVAIIDIEPGLVYLRAADDTFQRSEGMTDYYRSDWYAPYEKLAAGLSSEIRQGISEICSETIGFEQTMRLLLDQNMAWFPWEALLHAAVQSEIRSQTQIVRELLHAQKIEKEQIEHAWRQGAVHIYCSRDWRRMAEYMFSPISQAEVMVHHSRAKLLSMLRDSDSLLRILYLMGSPVATSDGLSFELGAGFAPVEQKIPTRGGDDDVFYITSQQLPAANVGMVILQPEPRQQQRRSESDREQAAYLRAFAAEISGAGAPLVLALPTLTPAETENCFKSMVEIVAAESRPGIDRIDSMLRMIRALIMKPIDDLPPRDREERADDLCIYYQP